MFRSWSFIRHVIACERKRFLNFVFNFIRIKILDHTRVLNVDSSLSFKKENILENGNIKPKSKKKLNKLMVVSCDMDSARDSVSRKYQLIIDTIKGNGSLPLSSRFSFIY